MYLRSRVCCTCWYTIFTYFLSQIWRSKDRGRVARAATRPGPLLTDGACCNARQRLPGFSASLQVAEEENKRCSGWLQINVLCSSGWYYVWYSVNNTNSELKSVYFFMQSYTYVKSTRYFFSFFFFLKSAPPVFMADIYDCMSKPRTRSLRQRLLSAMMIPLPLYQRVCLNTCMTYIQWPSSRSLLSYCCTSSELPKYHNRLYIRALLLDGTICALKLATHDDDDVLTLSIAHFPEISRVVT